MTLQPGKDFYIAYKVQPTKGTPPGDTGAKQLRIDPSPGLDLRRTLIENPEVRSDGQSSMPRLGTREGVSSYKIPVTIGGLDDILEAIMRSTWVAPVVITFDNSAELTSITVDSSSQITFTGTTTPVAAGLRNGDVFRLANMSTAANNATNCRVKSIAGSVVTLHGTPLTAQAADTACTLTIMKKLSNAASPTRRAFYIEEYLRTADQSKVGDYYKFISLKLVGSPNGNCTAEVQLLGADMQPLASGASPYYTDPTLNTAIRLVWADAVLSFNGADVATCQAFELTVLIDAATEPGIGSTGAVDVIDNDSKVMGSLTLLQSDLSNLTLYTAETEFELHLLLVEPESEPKDCLSFFVSRCKLTGATAPLGETGAMKETLPFTTGKKESVAGYDDSTLTICTSAAA